VDGRNRIHEHRKCPRWPRLMRRPQFWTISERKMQRKVASNINGSDLLISERWWRSFSRCFGTIELYTQSYHTASAIGASAHNSLSSIFGLVRETFQYQRLNQANQRKGDAHHNSRDVIPSMEKVREVKLPMPISCDQPIPIQAYQMYWLAARRPA